MHGAVLDALHPRQRQVLALIADGDDNAAIGRKLGLPLPLVKGYVSTLYALLSPPPGADARAWLAARYREHLAHGKPPDSR